MTVSLSRRLQKARSVKSVTRMTRFASADGPPGIEESMRRFDAAIAALAEFLCTEAGLPYPAWTEDEKRFAEPWWFVSGLRGFEATALRDSPIAFARHGVFVNEEAFERV